MHLTRSGDAVIYDPPGHVGVTARRLQGGEAGGPGRLLLGLSQYEPGAVVDVAATAADTWYVLVEGQLDVQVHDDDGAVHSLTLRAQDSVQLAAGEVRSVHNSSPEPALLLVVQDPATRENLA